MSLGEEISEQLGCRPKRYFVRQYVRYKYACASCHDQIARPPLPDTVIERGLAGAGVVAQVLVAKYADHLPLHRLSLMYRREGVDLDNPRCASGWTAARTCCDRSSWRSAARC